MKAWHQYLVLCVCAGILCEHSAYSCRCYGPASSPDPRFCKCRQLTEEEIIYYHDEFNATKPDSPASSPQPQFTVYPHSGTFVGGVKVSLSCNVSYTNTSNEDIPFTITWEHNGTAVDTSSSEMEQHRITTEQAGITLHHSMLTISHFSEAAQGDYVCRVGDGSYAIVSPVATLQLPKFLGWVNRAYPTPSHSDNITLTVQKGGSVILECSPNTTESLQGLTPVWLPQSKTTTLLPSGNVLMSNVQEDADFSCVWVFQAKGREFHIRLTSDPTPQQDLKLAVVPQDRVIIAGSSVEFYCIPESSAPASIQWFKDGLPVDDRVTIIGDGQVLEIEQADDSASGNYTCSTSDGSTWVNSSATLIVVDPPGNVVLSVSGSDVIITGSDAIIPVSTTNTSLSLHCHVETTGTMYYQWLRGGVMIESGYERDMLTVATSDPENVTGAYQCIVSTMAGLESSQAIRILRAKPCPPENVRIRKNTAPHAYFQYDISWHTPECEWNYSITNYTVEALMVYDPQAASFCSCSAEERMYAFMAGCSGINMDHTLYLRVAVNTESAGQSDFTSGASIDFAAGAPPKATNLRVEPISANLTTHMWDLSLTWNTNDIDAYSPRCYTTTVDLQCGTIISQESKRLNVSMNCCVQSCLWTVTNSNTVYYRRRSVTEGSIKTGAIRPSKPPQLLSVQRNGTCFSISFQLPEGSAACMCDSQSLRVTLHVNATSIAKTLSLDARTFDICLPGAHCLDAHDFSLAFNNSEGMSDFSRVLTVGSPTGSNLPTFSKELSITTSPDDVAVTYELQPGAGCLLSEGYLQAQICYILFTQELECSAAILSDSNVNCSSITTEQGSITLQRYYKYCIVAEISSNVLEPAYLHLTVPANESVPTSKPSSLTVDIVGSALEIWWEAPPFEKWNGIPDSYCLNISVDGMLVNTTRVPTSRNYSHFPSYDSGKTYDIMLSCCTSIGCGPVAVNTIPKTESQHGTNPPSDSSGVNGVVILASTLTSSAAVLLLLVMALIATTCFCYRRRRKRDRRYEELTESEAECSITLHNDEPLQLDREPPLGAIARSECTEIESLCRSRVSEWIDKQPLCGQQHNRRDAYMRDVEEELEHMPEVPNQLPTTTAGLSAQPSNTTAGLSAQPTLPVSLSPAPKRNISNMEALLKNGMNNSSGMTSALQSSSPAVCTALPAGYSTEQSLAELQTDTLPTLRNYGCLQTKAEVNDHSSTSPYHSSMKNATSNTGSYSLQSHSKCQSANADFISGLLCIEEFNVQNGSSSRDITTPHDPTSGQELAFTPTASSYIPSTSEQDVTCSTPSTSNSPRPLDTAEGEEGENDSVFDSSISPLPPSTADKLQRRTRSNITSGFCSLSNSSLDSAPSNEVEMTSLHSKHVDISQTPPLCSTLMHSTPLNPWATCSSSVKTPPVIPSCLPSQFRGNCQPSLLKALPPSYVNIEDQLVDESIRFEFSSSSSS